MKFRIISACMIASLFLAFFASSRSENDLPQAELLSYDYSYNTNFGIGYQTNTDPISKIISGMMKTNGSSYG